MDIEEARDLAELLMAEHGLGNWTFEFDRAIRRTGACHYWKTTISLSEPITRLRSVAEVRDVVLHEIAHALVAEDSTAVRPHGKEWRAMAVKLGVDPHHRSTATEWPAAKWRADCTVCGFTTSKQRRGRGSCPTCAAEYDPAYLLVWTAA
jgi:predicted SprT family Zn-dependent metalloprotease